MEPLKCKHILVLIALLSIISKSSTEILKPLQTPHHNYEFHKFRPPLVQEPNYGFFQRITSWFFPWGGDTPPSDMIKSEPPQMQNTFRQPPPILRKSLVPIRDTEPTTARTTQPPSISKCSPCNKVPWIPMAPTYQLPVLNSRPDQHQVYFKHHFGHENQYPPIPNNDSPTSARPIKIQNGNSNPGHIYYGIPFMNNLNNFEHSSQGYNFPKGTTFRPNTHTIDTSVITFTTTSSPKKRPLRFTAAGSSVTNSEYILPPNILPLENENAVPVPIPNLSPTPIPPLFDSKNFHHNPYANQKVGFIKLVPLEPVAQVSNNIGVQVKPDSNFKSFSGREKNSTIEVLNSHLVAEFTIPASIVSSTKPPPIKIQNFETTTAETTTAFKRDTAFTTLYVDNNLDKHASDNFGEESNDNFKISVDETIDTEESNRIFGVQENTIAKNEEKYTVKFEPSIQTAADLAEKNKSIPTDTRVKKKERKTPVELLDSPILHVTPFTFRPKVFDSTESPPPFKPIEDFTKKLATLWTSPPPSPISTTIPSTKSYQKLTSTPSPTQKTPVFTSTSTFLSSSSYQKVFSTPTSTETTSAFPSSTPLSIQVLSTLSEIKPPKESTPKPLQSSTKKPKQIQIVIPYTTLHEPAPFKTQEEQKISTYSPVVRGFFVTHPTKKPELNDIYHNDQEYHAQESKIVESKVTVEPPKTTKYLTKILANNIRDLLKSEKTQSPPKIDIIKLQKNINGWTEQSFLGKASTIAQTGHTKAIPISFISSTMQSTTKAKISSTTAIPRHTFEPELMEETKRQYDSILFKKDDHYVKRHDRFLNRDNELVLINNNLTNSFRHDGVKVFAPRTTLTPKELWKKLHITISPLTKEKIYVVTPQPQHSQEENRNEFKPRFSIRPTVSVQRQQKNVKSKTRPDEDLNQHIHDKSKDKKV